MATRVPKVASIEIAVRMYYENLDLDNKDIRKLFPNIGGTRLLGLKRMAKERMDELKLIPYNATTVRTKAAYEAWGLDIKDLEVRLNKLKNLCV